MDERATTDVTSLSRQLGQSSLIDGSTVTGQMIVPGRVIVSGRLTVAVRTEANDG